MKRMLLCLLCLLLLTGCHLKNRQDSRNFVPENRSNETNPPAASAKPEEPELTGSPLKEIKTLEGSYVYGGETVNYSYCLPYLDLSGDYAVGCNAEIEAEFGEPIREAQKAMEERRLPKLSQVGYESWQYGNVLCLMVYRVQTLDGERFEALYTVNALTGSAPTPDELFAAAGTTRDSFREKLHDAIADFYAETFGAYYDPEDFHYLEGLNSTLAQGLLDTVVPVSLTKTGELLAAVTVIDPAGAASTARIPVPAG